MYTRRKNKKEGDRFRWIAGVNMAGKRKPESELMRSITINLQQKVIDEIAKEGTPKKLIEKMVNDKYKKS